jgi:3-keto-disaccharide hydrolase
LQDCSQFPEIRKKNDWNHLRVMFKGDRLQIWMNDKQITDVEDKPMAGEESWVEPAPISFQPFGESGGFVGKIQFRNIRIRTP